MRLFKRTKWSAFLLPLIFIARAYGLVNIKQELPISIGATEAAVLEKLGRPIKTDSEWIFYDENGAPHYYVEFRKHIVSQVKISNLSPRGDRTEKVVNGLTLRDSYRQWIKVLGKPAKIIPADSGSTVLWQTKTLWIGLSVDSAARKNTWGWVLWPALKIELH